jgi:hypothetical protein
MAHRIVGDHSGDRSAFHHSTTRRAALPQEIQALFRQFQPYKKGNGQAIWILNELRNRVYTTLVPVDITDRKLGIFWSEGGVELHSHWSGPAELVVKGRTFDGKSDFHLKFKLEIRFDQVDITGRKSATAVLAAASREVKKIVEETKNLCRLLSK